MLCRPNGRVFSVSDTAIDVKCGDVVTVAYDDFSKSGIPTNPKILRVRSDISWKDYLVRTKFLNGMATTSKSIGSPQGETNSEKNDAMREVFINVARQFCKDPFSAETWYSIPQPVILQQQVMHRSLIDLTK